MVTDKETLTVAAPVIKAAPPAPPPRSTPLQAQLIQQQLQQEQQTSDNLSSLLPPPPHTSQDEDSGVPSSGETSAESSSPIRPSTQHFLLDTHNSDSSQDGPDSLDNRDGSSGLSSPVKMDTVDKRVCDDQIVAQGHVRDSSDICETSFDNIPAAAMTVDTADKPETKPEEMDEAETKPEEMDEAETKPEEMEEAETKPEETDQANMPEEKEKPKMPEAAPSQTKVAPPVPLRRSSTRTSVFASKPEASDESGTGVSEVNRNPISPVTSESQGRATHKELKRLPSIKEKKAQLAKMIDTASKPSHPEKHPGRVVIADVLKGVPAGLPVNQQHPMLIKKQEEAAARERVVREREEQDRLEREMARQKEQREKQEREIEEKRVREKEEKRRSRRFSFKRKPKKEKERVKGVDSGTTEPVSLPPTSTEQRQRSMSAQEQKELQSKFKHITHHNQSSTPSDTDPPSLSQAPRAEQNDSPDSQSQHLQTPHVHTNSSRSSTLDRTAPKPPSANPPSLPGNCYGSIERTSRQRSTCRTDTLERQVPSQPSSGLGSQQGTLERPPPPTSQPPPVPLEVKRGQAQPKPRSVSVGSIGLNGGRIDLAEVVLGVERSVLTAPIQESQAESESESETRQQKLRAVHSVTTFPTNPPHPPSSRVWEAATEAACNGHGGQPQGAGFSVIGGRCVQTISAPPTQTAVAPMSSKRWASNNTKRKSTKRK